MIDILHSARVTASEPIRSEMAPPEPSALSASAPSSQVSACALLEIRASIADEMIAAISRILFRQELTEVEANRRSAMTANVLKFPLRTSEIVQSLLETARGLEKAAPSDCIAIQNQVIAIMSEEVAQSRRTAYAAMRALTAIKAMSGDSS